MKASFKDKIRIRQSVKQMFKDLEKVHRLCGIRVKTLILDIDYDNIFTSMQDMKQKQDKPSCFEEIFNEQSNKGE